MRKFDKLYEDVINEEDKGSCDTIPININEDMQKDVQKDVKKMDDKFKYQLLGRLQSDCDYYLGNGGRSAKHLWADTEIEHITYMFEIYKSFKSEPKWLSMDDISKYEKQMIK